MPVYNYEAVNAKGKKVQGTLRGMNKQAVINDLRKQGLTLRSVQEKQKSIWDQDVTLGPPVKLEQFVAFCRQFATLIRSGVMIEPAIKLLEEQTANKPLREALGDILEQLRNGSSLSGALIRHPKIFPAMFVNMISAGEVTGEIEQVLTRLANHYERENRTIKKLKSAMVYPVIVLSIAILAVGFLLTNVVPVFANMFAQQNMELPATTKAVMAVSEWLQASWWILILIAFVLWISFQLLKDKPKVRFILDGFLIRMPLFGPLFLKATLARMTRTLSALFRSAVPVLQSMEIAERVVGNAVVAKFLNDSRQGLQEGRTIAEVFNKNNLIPKTVNQMIAIGEETGQIEEMLGRIADAYEDDVDQSVDQLKSLIEPLMILGLSGLIGVIVLAIMSPMFKMYENFL